MEITAEQFKRIEPILPVQRGNVSLSNLDVVNAILYVAENGCKWRALPNTTVLKRYIIAGFSSVVRG